MENWGEETTDVRSIGEVEGANEKGRPKGSWMIWRGWRFEMRRQTLAVMQTVKAEGVARRAELSVSTVMLEEGKWVAAQARPVRALKWTRLNSQDIKSPKIFQR